MINFLIKNNLTIGLFDKTNELVAWVLQIDTGSLAVLQVDENHRRKGYGEVVTRVIAKKIAMDRDSDVTANVKKINQMSTNLFKKLNFKDIDKNYWMVLMQK